MGAAGAEAPASCSGEGLVKVGSPSTAGVTGNSAITIVATSGSQSQQVSPFAAPQLSCGGGTFRLGAASTFPAYGRLASSASRSQSLEGAPSTEHLLLPRQSQQLV